MSFHRALPISAYVFGCLAACSSTKSSTDKTADASTSDAGSAGFADAATHSTSSGEPATEASKSDAATESKSEPAADASAAETATESTESKSEPAADASAAETTASSSEPATDASVSDTVTASSSEPATDAAVIETTSESSSEASTDASVSDTASDTASDTVTESSSEPATDASVSDTVTASSSETESDAAVGETAIDASTTDAATESTTDAAADAAASSLTVLDLDDVVQNPNDYDWFDFRPNLEKLILAGAAETEHVALLWYTIEDGSVGLHYHSMTESVYAIDGSQSDAKGTYPTGTVYFNPPGSGHAISNSSGFFILAYASPPDFANTELIEEYTPIRIDTTDPQLTTAYSFVERATGVRTYDVPLDSAGGMTAAFIETTSRDAYTYVGNYVLVLEGSCEIEGMTLGKNMLVVAKTIATQSFAIAGDASSPCLTMGVSF